MTFYINPPRGKSPLASLEDDSHKRLEFLISVFSCQGNINVMKDLIEQESTMTGSECLIEGNKRDAISHFNLRLASCQCREMMDFFIRAETLFFKFRFSIMSMEDLRMCYKPLKAFTKKLRKYPSACEGVELKLVRDILFAVSQQNGWEIVIEQFYHCTKGLLHLPFQCVLPLVAMREVVLIKGIAAVPTAKMCDVMCILFEAFLKHGIHLCYKQLELVTGDSRIRRLYKSLKSKFDQSSVIFKSPDYHGNLDPIRANAIDDLAESFPPCMAYLHSELRRKHRLRHFSRIQYTLFLKEIGLPVHEAIQFWRQEYSQTPGEPREKHARGHSWDKDWKRYVYSIRHLYGMEGSRRNYRAHCCESLKGQNYSAVEEGGCIFARFDKSHLGKELGNQGAHPEDVPDILDLHRLGERQVACQKFLASKASLLGYTKAKLSANDVATDGRDSGINTHSDILSASSEASDDIISQGSRDLFEDDYSNEEHLVEEPSHSCYDHKECPPSQVKSMHLSQSSDTAEVSFNLQKPVDFFITYQNLLRGLRAADSL